MIYIYSDEIVCYLCEIKEFRLTFVTCIWFCDIFIVLKRIDAFTFTYKTLQYRVLAYASFFVKSQLIFCSVYLSHASQFDCRHYSLFVFVLQICKYHIILPEMCIYVRYLLHPPPDRGVKYDERVHEIFCTLSVAVAAPSCDDNAVYYVDSMTSWVYV